MQVVNTIAEVRSAVARARRAGKTIGFVPTMGALHIGHLSLMERAGQECGFLVVSIFVNPTQFGPAEDFDKYPRDLEGDAVQCESVGVDLVFAPNVSEMYPSKNLTWVAVEGLTDTLCGASRPGHFRGVTTVCSKLFQIVQPDKAFFGHKDAQQAIVIQRMVADLNMPLEIVVCPTVRESDGLAVSSRNQYLTAQERKQAPVLYRALRDCQRMVAAGCVDRRFLVSKMTEIVESVPLAEIEYIEIVDAHTLQRVETVRTKALVAMAVKFGATRLIDNILIDLDSH